MTTQEMQEILKNVHFNGWKFQVFDEVTIDPGGSNSKEYLKPGYLQVKFRDRDGQTQYGRKWKLSAHMTKSEIVQTAFKAALAAVEHEVREDFLYRGKAIFSPHYDVDSLWEIAEQQDVREE